MPSIQVDYNKLVDTYHNLTDGLLADEYRGCTHIPIRWLDMNTPGKKTLNWTTYANNVFPEVKQYIIDYLEPWVGLLPRMMIIVTPPKTEGLPHIDCIEEDFDQTQLKFRVVLNGKTSTLYFLNQQDQREYAQECNQKPFLMCGKWPHGLDNFTEDYKFTLAIGAPWKCELNPEFEDLLTRSKFNNGWTDKSQIQLMPDYHKYFKTDKLEVVKQAERQLGLRHD